MACWTCERCICRMGGLPCVWNFSQWQRLCGEGFGLFYIMGKSPVFSLQFYLCVTHNLYPLVLHHVTSGNETPFDTSIPFRNLFLVLVPPISCGLWQWFFCAWIQCSRRGHTFDANPGCICLDCRNSTVEDIQACFECCRWKRCELLLSS
jgi:hypothetical protein